MSTGTLDLTKAMIVDGLAVRGGMNTSFGKGNIA
jgi:hypothetical protein